MSEGDLASWIVAGSFVHERRVGSRTRSGCPTPPRNTREAIPLRWRQLATATGTPARCMRSTDGRRLRGSHSITVGITRATDTSPRIVASSAPASVSRSNRPKKRHAILDARRPAHGRAGSRRVPAASDHRPGASAGAYFAPFLDADMRAERARLVDLQVEHDFGDAYVFGVRRFYQNVDDQLVTLFRVSPAGTPQSVGHYYVANVGAFDASGWAFRMSSPESSRMRASVDYAVTKARWTSVNNQLGVVTPALVRPETENVHDITTSIHTDIPGDRDSVLSDLPHQQRLHARRCVDPARVRRPLRRAGEPGAPVRCRWHEMGSARRPTQSVPRRQRTGIDLRRTARRPSPEASRWRLPRPFLTSLGGGPFSFPISLRARAAASRRFPPTFALCQAKVAPP